MLEYNRLKFKQKRSENIIRKIYTVAIGIILFLILSFANVFAADLGETTLNINGNLLPVYTLQKSGNDNENFVILFLGDGYTLDEQDKFMSDISSRAAHMLEIDPYRKYSDKINMYVVPTISAESGVSETYGTKLDTYFQLQTWGNITSLTNPGEQKARDIKSAMERSYLDYGATVGTIHILSNSTARFGTSTSRLFSYSSLLSDYQWGHALIHEISHSIGKLQDEYGRAYPGVNVAKSEKAYENPENVPVPWTKLLGFRGTGIINNENDPRGYIPSHSCIMKSLDTIKFCEVCKLELVMRMNLTYYTQLPDKYYIAEPDVTIEHSNIHSIGDAYEKYRINEKNIYNANGHTLELRTVVQNLINREYKLAMAFKITSANGKEKYFKEETFVIPPFVGDYDAEPAKKSLSVTFENVSGLVYGDKIIGQVIDLDTQEVVSEFSSSEKVMSKINIHHKVKDKNGIIREMPNTEFTKIYVPRGSMYTPKTPLQLNGYIYIGNSLQTKSIVVNDNIIDLDFYYAKPDDDNGIITKISDDGKTFLIEPYNIREKADVILALYNGETICELKTFSYNGLKMTHTTDKNYSSAQIMVWKDFIPLCKSEIK